MECDSFVYYYKFSHPIILLRVGTRNCEAFYELEKETVLKSDYETTL